MNSFKDFALLIPIFLLCSSFDLITDYRFINDKHPLHMRTEYREVTNAEFRTHSVKGSHVKNADAFAFLYYSHFLNEDNALSWKVGYSYLDFDWAKNPRFKESAYHFANASVAWISTAIQDWRWIISAATSVDAQTFDFGQSGVYYGMMWGRYCLSECIGLHVGWLGYYGVETGYFLPVVGLDWQMSERWRFHGIFPFDISLNYQLNPFWTLALAGTSFGRPYRFPMRDHGGIGRYRNGIFEVYSTGVEVDLKYCNQSFHAGFGLGWNFGGWILIKDHHGHHGKYYKYDGAPYAQAKASITF